MDASPNAPNMIDCALSRQRNAPYQTALLLPLTQKWLQYQKIVNRYVPRSRGLLDVTIT